MRDKDLKVCIYNGGWNIIKKSGIGKAIEHQTEIIKHQGISVIKRKFWRADIVHLNTVFPDSVFVALITKLLGGKVIYYGHSTMEDFRNSFVGSDVLAPFFKKWICFCYALGDVIITPTEYSKRILETYGIQKPIFAVSNGIDNSFWRNRRSANDGMKKIFLEKYHIPAGKKIVMSVGHYIERKGILDFIETAGKNQNMTFIWFGYTDPKLIPPEIRNAIRYAPDNLIFAGYVDSEELKKAYDFCDVFLFMSHEETEGIVVLEAMASGIPVIVRDIPVYEGWLKNGFNAYKFRSEEEAANMIQSVLENDMNYITENARYTAGERDYIRIGERMMRMYHEDINRKFYYKGCL